MLKAGIWLTTTLLFFTALNAGAQSADGTAPSVPATTTPTTEPVAGETAPSGATPETRPIDSGSAVTSATSSTPAPRAETVAPVGTSLSSTTSTEPTTTIVPEVSSAPSSGSAVPSIVPAVPQEPELAVPVSGVNNPAQTSLSSKSLLIPLGVGALAVVIFGVVFAQQTKKRKEEGTSCDALKQRFEEGEAELRRIGGECSVQELLIVELQKKIDNISEEIKDATKEELRDAIVRSDKSGVLSSAVETAEHAKEIYDELKEKYDTAKELCEVLRRKKGEMGEDVRMREAAWSACVGRELSVRSGEGGVAPALAEDTPVKIIPITHATLVIEWGDTIFYADPTSGGAAFAGQPSPDIVLITDIHRDHMDPDTLHAVLGSGLLIVPQSVKNMLPEDLAARARVMNNGDTMSENGFQISALPMYNLPESSESKHTKGRGNGYVLERDGCRVYIAGDTAGIPEMRTLTNIHSALVPMNLPYTMGIEEAADAVLEFKPKHVYPYHYRSPDGLADVARFKELVHDGDPDIDVVLLEWYPK